MLLNTKRAHSSRGGPQAARDPETIRRWIRSGRLRASWMGNRHLIDEDDLSALSAGRTAALPPSWRQTIGGQPMPDVVSWIHDSRNTR